MTPFPVYGRTHMSNAGLNSVVISRLSGRLREPVPLPFDGCRIGNGFCRGS